MFSLSLNILLVHRKEHVCEQSESPRLAVTAGAQQACGAASSLWLLSHGSGLCRQEARQT